MACQCKTDKQRARCPWWIGPEYGILKKHKDTGQHELKTGCFTEVMLWLQIDGLARMLSATSAVESARNKIDGAVTAFGNAGRAMIEMHSQQAAIAAQIGLMPPDSVLQIEMERDDAELDGQG